MVAVYFVIAAFLYWPFRRWVATSAAPAMCALLWPLLVVFFIGAILIAPFSKEKL